ncbi:MAG: hypothetical protein ABIA74_01040, partial [bacterium]
MKNNLFYFLFFTLTIFTTKIFAPFTPPSPEEMEGFEEFMKNIDMDQLVKEMEDVFGPMDEKEPPISPETKKEAAKPAAKKEIPKKDIPKIKEDRETTFKKPMDVSEGESSKTVTKLPKEKREAYQFYMNDFLRLLDSVESKIDSFELGIPFKEELEDLKLGGKKINYKELTSNIKIQNGQITSKQLYQRGFYLPSNNQTREGI